MRKAVIFDLDGTLLDTVADLGDAMNSVLKGLGLPLHGYDAYKIFIGDGMRMLVARALPPDRRGEEAVRDALAAMEREYGRSWKNKTRPYDGIQQLLDEIESRNIPMSVLSNKPDALTKQNVQEFFPGSNFSFVYGARDGIPRKPDPKAALEIAQRMGFQPEQIFYLGDTGTDMRTARGAGMYPVGALWGFRSAEELRENGAKRLISEPLELVSFLE